MSHPNSIFPTRSKHLLPLAALLLWGCTAPTLPPALAQNAAAPNVAAVTPLKVAGAFTSADGASITVTFAGLQGDLAPQTQVSGFAFTALPLVGATPFDLAIASSHVEGDRVIFTLAKPILAGQIVRGGAANSSLTDGAGAKFADAKVSR